MAEYAVVLGVITPAVVLSLAFMSETVAATFESLAALIP